MVVEEVSIETVATSGKELTGRAGGYSFGVGRGMPQAADKTTKKVVKIKYLFKVNPFTRQTTIPFGQLTFSSG
jgi:hypothetical protein